MSGRGGKSYGHGYKGKKPQGKSGGMPKTEAKKIINDYYHYLRSAKQAYNYQVTTEFIINHILTTYKYGEVIGQALEEECEALTDMWVPDLQKSTNTDPAAKAKEDEEFKMLWKAKLNEYMRRKRTCKNNRIEAGLWPTLAALCQGYE
jgi:hypothetical protein